MTKFTTLCGYADAAVDNTEWDLFGNDATELKPTTTSAFEKKSMFRFSSIHGYVIASFNW